MGQISKKKKKRGGGGGGKARRAQLNDHHLLNADNSDILSEEVTAFSLCSDGITWLNS
ncbi:hypothetical protein M569_14875 [Genlisea aurea]|uniref:Uncharacterized protein n=1 Tax=Genlisea aurea TaxID=192259 RepID=S8BZF5_9LAMI|nr:hypothetical protein M569_14875 [Genlisea aurea]